MTKMILWIFPALSLALVFAVLVPLAAPYDNSQYEELLAFFSLSEICDTPCFLGIQPGVTGFEEAALLIELHPWVQRVWIRNEQMDLHLRWTWNGKQPSFLQSPGIIESSQRTIVSVISVPTSLSFGDLFMALGEPDDGQMSRYYHMARYHDLGIIAWMATDCRDFWQGTSLLHFSARSQFPKTYSVSKAWHEACI